LQLHAVAGHFFFLYASCLKPIVFDFQNQLSYNSLINARGIDMPVREWQPRATDLAFFSDIVESLANELLSLSTAPTVGAIKEAVRFQMILWEPADLAFVIAGFPQQHMMGRHSQLLQWPDSLSTPTEYLYDLAHYALCLGVLAVLVERGWAQVAPLGNDWQLAAGTA
jgi:hypothetical protein